jgi:hypothetical protein
MGVETLLVAALGRGEWIDQRPAVHLPVILVERPDHCPGVPPGPGRIVAGRRRLAGDCVTTGTAKECGLSRV